MASIIIGLKYATFDKKENNLVVSYSTTGYVFYLHTSLHCLSGLLSKVTVIIFASLNRKKVAHSRTFSKTLSRLKLLSVLLEISFHYSTLSC